LSSEVAVPLLGLPASCSKGRFILFTEPVS
jgi:hypothetical protein